MSPSAMPRLNQVAAAARNLVMRIEAEELRDDAARATVATACALAVHIIDGGNVCLYLKDIAGKGLPDAIRELSRNEISPSGDQMEAEGYIRDFSFPGLRKLRECLLSAHSAVESAGDATTLPFIVADIDSDDRARLYTRRNYLYEANVRTRLSAISAGEAAAAAVSLPSISRWGDGEQKAAAKNIASRRFSILTGGPGTGKTTTIACAIATYLLNCEDPSAKKILLAAPTGKAANRMAESIADGIALIREAGAGPAVIDAMPKAGSTIHRVLGPRHGSTDFKHGEKNPLDADWLILDESSMIDLPLLSKTLDALPPDCKLTLIGDKDQLASVERGRAFAELCEWAGQDGSRIKDALSRISTNHRTSGATPEGKAAIELARKVNRIASESDAIDVAGIIAHGQGAPFHELRGGDCARTGDWYGFWRAVDAGFGALADAKSAQDAFMRIAGGERKPGPINDFRILCALRRGPFGAERINEAVRRHLEKSRGAIPLPYMVTKNDPSLNVSNGDVGVVMPREPDVMQIQDASSNAMGAEGGMRKISLSLLPSRELAFATTIHKSQGSEFADVAIVLPFGDSPILTREIIYTAITRTRNSVEIWGSKASLKACLSRTVQRTSGLALPEARSS